MIDTSTTLVPMVITITLTIFYICALGAIDKIFRYSKSEITNLSVKNYILPNLLKLSFEKTSIYSLVISLLRFNTLLYLTIKIILNNIFGSDIRIYNLLTILTFILVSEFLLYLKTKKRSEINEVSSFIVTAFLTLVCIGITKESLNIGITTKIEWFSTDSFLNNWEIINIPVLLIPIVYILVFSYSRLLEAYKNLNIKTADRIFDFLSEGLLFIYFVILFIKSVFGGGRDIIISELDLVIPYFQILNISIKFLILTFLVRLIVRFIPTQINKKKSKNINLTIVLLLFTNVSFVLYLRNLN